MRANIDEPTLDLNKLLLALALLWHVLSGEAQVCVELIDGAEGLEDLAVFGQTFACEEG